MVEWEDTTTAVRECLMQLLVSCSPAALNSSGTSSAIAHKVADAVVNGATSTSKKVADAIAKVVTSASVNAVKTAIDSAVKKVKGTKRPTPAAEPSIVVQPSPPKRKKIHIDSLIDGSGIVYA